MHKKHMKGTYMNKVEAQMPLAKRLLISFFAFALVVGLMPINAWAEGDDAQSSANQEQQAGQDEGDSAGDSTDDTAEKGSTEGADSSASGDASADKDSSDGDDSSAGKSSAGKSTEGTDSSASEGSDEDNDKSANDSDENANSETNEANDVSEENIDAVNQGNNIVLAASNAQAVYEYTGSVNKEWLYDRLNGVFDPIWHFVTYVIEDPNTSEELFRIGLTTTGTFIPYNYGEAKYKVEWGATGEGELILHEKVNISSPDPYVAFDGVEHKWVPEVTATANPNFSSSDYVVKYYRDGVETSDLTNPGDITVSIQGTGSYSYVSESKTYTIDSGNDLSVSVTDYEGCYDGESHGDAAVASYTEGTTIEYSTDGDNWSTTVPKVKDVTEDAVIVYVRAKNDKFSNTAEASYTLEVIPAEVVAYVEGNSDTVDYDGQYHQVSNFEVTEIRGVEEGLYDKEKVALKGDKTAFVEANQAGTWHMGLTADSFTNADTNFDVTFGVTDGVLTIKPAEVTVSVKGNSAAQTYNGAEQSVFGFEVTGVEGDQAQLYNTDKVALADDVAAEAEGTDAGTYGMGLTKESFANKDSNFIVSFNVTDGSLTIDKRALELNDSASFVYNGKEQVLNIDASKVAGLVDGDRLNLFNAQVKGTEPGTYDEVSEYTWDVINDELNVTKNYTLNVTGTLTITEEDSSADADADNDSSDNESSDNGSDASSDSETPQTGDFAQFAMGAALAAAIAALGALFATRRFRGERL